jgi:hypothetical protein
MRSDRTTATPTAGTGPTGKCSPQRTQRGGSSRDERDARGAPVPIPAPQRWQNDPGRMHSL